MHLLCVYICIPRCRRPYILHNNLRRYMYLRIFAQLYTSLRCTLIKYYKIFGFCIFFAFHLVTCNWRNERIGKPTNWYKLRVNLSFVRLLRHAVFCRKIPWGILAFCFEKIWACYLWARFWQLTWWKKLDRQILYTKEMAHFSYFFSRVSTPGKSDSITECKGDKDEAVGVQW